MNAPSQGDDGAYATQMVILGFSMFSSVLFAGMARWSGLLLFAWLAGAFFVLGVRCSGSDDRGKWRFSLLHLLGYVIWAGMLMGIAMAGKQGL